MTRAPALDWALFGLLALLWGGAFVFVKIAVETIGPLTLVALRTSLAALLLGTLAWALGLRLPNFRAEWPLYLRQALLLSLVPSTLIAWGSQTVAAGLAGILSATPPLWVFLMTLLWTRAEAATPRRALGLLLGLAGVATILGVEALADLGRTLPAQAAILLAAVCYASANVFGARFTAPPLAVAAASAGFAALVALPLAALFERPWAMEISARSLLAALTVAVLANGLGFILFFRVVRSLGPIATSSGVYLNAAVAVALGALLLGERLAPSTFAAFGLIVLGLLLVGPARRGAARPPVARP